MSQSSRTAVPPAPAGSATLDPFVMTDDAPGMIDFVVAVFGAVEVAEARTLDTDGLVLHAELRIGDSTLTIADRKPDWPYTPAFLRVYVDDPEATLARAEAHGGRVVTRPTDFWGDVLSRMADPFGHLWWVYRHDSAAAGDASAPASASADAADGWTDGGWADGGGEDDWSSYATPELTYVHTTLLEAMASLRDPRTP